VLNQGALGAIIVGVVVSIIIAFRPTFVKPGGRSRTQNSETTKVLHCANCRLPMNQLNATSVKPFLSHPEQVAQKLGSVRFEGWLCPRCQQNLTGQNIHIRAYVLDRYRFRSCPTCQELTVQRTSKTIELATNDQEGKRSVTETCHCCAYVNQKVEVIPRKVSDSGYWSSSGYSAGEGSWSNDRGGSWDGDGGSFGGGDSGGGGDGGSW